MQPDNRQQLIADISEIINHGIINQKTFLFIVDEKALLNILDKLIANFEKTPSGRSQICTAMTSILNLVENPTVLDATENFLIRFASTREKSDVCLSWTISRQPRLEKIIRERKWKPEKDKRETWAYTVALKFGYLDWLHKNIVYEWDARQLAMTLYDADLEIVARAKIEINKLMGGYRTEAFRILENMALQNYCKKFDETALRFFIETDYKPPQPQLLVQMGLMAGNLDMSVPALNNPEAIDGLVRNLGFSEANEVATQALNKLKNPVHIKTVCDLILHPSLARSLLSQLEEIAVTAGYEPDEPTEKVVFYFLTQQFDKYDALDFDRRILRGFYAGATPEQCRQIAAIVRESGRVEYLQVLSYEATHSDEWATANYIGALFDVLKRNEQWEPLWQKVFELPLEHSRKALDILHRQNWQPLNEYECELYNHLLEIARGEFFSTVEVAPMLPSAILRATLRAAGRVNSLAFAPDGTRVAVATGNRKVVIWNLAKGEREIVLRDFSHSVGKVVFTPDGGLVCAERTQGLKACGVYFWNGKTLRRLGEQAGAVTALAALEQGWAASGGNDKRVTIWNIATGEARAVLRLNDTVRQIELLPELNRLLVFADQLYVYDATSYDEIGRYGKFYRVVSAAAVNADASLVAVGDNGGYLEIYRLDYGALSRYTPDEDFAHKAWTEHNPVRDLALNEKLKLLVKGNANGQMRFVDYGQKRLLGKLALLGEKLTSLELSADGNFMATGDGDSSFGLWDLRPLQVVALLEQPLGSATARDMAGLKILQDENLELPIAAQNALKYIETVLRHRFRHDIEVEFAPNIQPGDFDIELESN